MIDKPKKKPENPTKKDFADPLNLLKILFIVFVILVFVILIGVVISVW
jgi:hypothetical protein